MVVVVVVVSGADVMLVCSLWSGNFVLTSTRFFRDRVCAENDLLRRQVMCEVFDSVSPR